MDDCQIDNFINQLISFRPRSWVGSWGMNSEEQQDKEQAIEMYESIIKQLCPVAGKIFSTEPTLLELQAPITIIGDLDNLGLEEIFRSCTSKYLYLGNYCGDTGHYKNFSRMDEYCGGFDTGENHWTTILLLLAFKIRYPKSLFLLKSNFNPWVQRLLVDEPEMAGYYGQTDSDLILYDCLRSIPVAALVNDKIICRNGGLSPDLHRLDEIRQRPTTLPAYSPFHLALLAVPPNVRRPVDRDIFFAKELEFLEKHDLRLICCDRRQVMSEFFFVRGRVVSLKSYVRFDPFMMNVYVDVDANLKCSLNHLRNKNSLCWSYTIKRNGSKNHEVKELNPGERKSQFLFGSGDSIAQSGSSSGVVNPVDNKTTTTKNSKFEDVAAPMVKPFGWMNISKFGRSNAKSKPESSQGVNPSKSSTSTAKNRSKSPEIKNILKPAERITVPSNIGSIHPTITNKLENSLGVNASTSKATRKNRSVSPGLMPAKGINKSNTGTTNVVTDKPESSQEARPFEFDLETLYRSKSPGVKRFIGARV